MATTAWFDCFKYILIEGLDIIKLMSFWNKLSDNKAVTGLVAAFGLGGLVYWYAAPYIGPTRAIKTSKGTKKNPLLFPGPIKPFLKVSISKPKSTNLKHRLI